MLNTISTFHIEEGSIEIAQILYTNRHRTHNCTYGLKHLYQSLPIAAPVKSSFVLNGELRTAAR